ncbi:ribonuclease inhibitor [Altererythrobacter xixiisoli]|uniref:Ribonuclease inhibitor n=1 Tax=Croceibacterium xixiisoli TaxID=1476466 RepID=A0A6I4TVI8_9SPHN|nr:barstar family protein [Croceibacterium xixiisoli]MXO99229.1 ribonuclease inhibitor [Croceibacterium xixiisoli]
MSPNDRDHDGDNGASIIIEGAHIRDIASFYVEINRVFMAGEDWQLGHSLDALDDMLYGGYGALQGDAPVVLIWRQMQRNRQDLGRDATRGWYQAKLDQPEGFNVQRIRADLDALERGEGPTFFDIVQQIIADHPNITLQPE